MTRRTDPDPPGLDIEWHERVERMRIIDEVQFTGAEAMEVAEITSVQMKHAIDRRTVNLREGNNPGSGRRRMYCGGDILKLGAAYKVSPLGFPLKWAYLIGEEVVTRASVRLMGLDPTPNLATAMFPLDDGDWARIPLHDNLKEAPALPNAFVLFNIDGFIDQTLAKLRAIVEDKPKPELPDYRPKVEASPYSPNNDFFFAWEKDADGHNVLSGLTKSETEEYGAGDVDNARYVELDDKHEKARQKRLAETLKHREERERQRRISEAQEGKMTDPG